MMNWKPAKSAANSARRALTLIEVTASLLILSTLLVASILAFERHARQIRRAQRVLKAVSAADSLLSTWTDAGMIPLPSEGEIADDDSLVWRVAALDAGSVAAGSTFQIARLQIIDKTQEEAPPLADVDIVAPIAEPEGR